MHRADSLRTTESGALPRTKGEVKALAALASNNREEMQRIIMVNWFYVFPLLFSLLQFVIMNEKWIVRSKKSSEDPRKADDS
jgi:hypothetical protein